MKKHIILGFSLLVFSVSATGLGGDCVCTIGKSGTTVIPVSNDPILLDGFYQCPFECIESSKDPAVACNVVTKTLPVTYNLSASGSVSTTVTLRLDGVMDFTIYDPDCIHVADFPPVTPTKLGSLRDIKKK